MTTTRLPADPPRTPAEVQAPPPARPGRVRPYVAIARPDYWVKNVFMAAGVLMAYFYHPDLLRSGTFLQVLWALLATCFLASSNYVLNEILDAPTDRNHPRKRYRPVASGRVLLPLAYAEWAGLGILGLGVASLLNWPFFFSGLSLLVMGLVYNVPPVRAKEQPYIDVLTESVNNPIRLHHPWYREDRFSDPGGGLSLGRVSLGFVDAVAQPAFNEDRSLVAVMAGELFEAAEHRRTLTAAGHRFWGTSHAEVAAPPGGME